MEHAMVMFPYGWALAELGQVEQGISRLRSALEAQLSTGGQIARPQLISYLAEVFWHAGQAEEGLKAVEDGLGMSERTGNTHYDAELWRLKASF
jgi:hypothetical protein